MFVGRGTVVPRWPDQIYHQVFVPTLTYSYLLRKRRYDVTLQTPWAYWPLILIGPFSQLGGIGEGWRLEIAIGF